MCWLSFFLEFCKVSVSILTPNQPLHIPVDCSLTIVVIRKKNQPNLLHMAGSISCQGILCAALHVWKRSKKLQGFCWSALGDLRERYRSRGKSKWEIGSKPKGVFKWRGLTTLRTSVGAWFICSFPVNILIIWHSLKGTGSS